MEVDGGFPKRTRTDRIPLETGRGDFPEGGEPALLGHGYPGNHGLDASSTQELPGPKRKTEISVGRSLRCCALSQLPSRYPVRWHTRQTHARCGWSWQADSRLANSSRFQGLTTGPHAGDL